MTNSFSFPLSEGDFHFISEQFCLYCLKFLNLLNLCASVFLGVFFAIISWNAFSVALSFSFLSVPLMTPVFSHLSLSRVHLRLLVLSVCILICSSFDPRSSWLYYWIHLVFCFLFVFLFLWSFLCPPFIFIYLYSF